MDSFKDGQFMQLNQVVNAVKLQKNDYLIKAGSICGFIGFVEFNVDFYLSGSFVSSYTSFLTLNIDL